MKHLWLLALLAVVGLSGCVSTTYGTAGYAPHQNHRSLMFGEIVDIQPVAVQAQGTGGGAVIGALIGGVLGNQVGDGRGRDLATVGGAVAGGVIGNNLEKEQATRARKTVYEIFVRLDDGRVLAVIQEDVYGLNIGSAVEVLREGRWTRVVAR